MTPILIPLPDELVGERIVLRPRQPGTARPSGTPVEESREQIGLWLPWVEGTKSAEDCEAVGPGHGARWILREDLMVGIWELSSRAGIWAAAACIALIGASPPSRSATGCERPPGARATSQKPSDFSAAGHLKLWGPTRGDTL